MKKLAIYASIATLGLFSAVGLSAKPVEVMAEGEDSSLLSSEPQAEEPSTNSEEEAPQPAVSSEATSPVEETASENPDTWEKVQNIEIEGKTIKEWVEGIKNEETRRTTIIALVIAVGTLTMFVLKWLAERGLIKKGNTQSEKVGKALEEVKELYSKFEVMQAEAKARLEALQAEGKTGLEAMQEEAKGKLEVLTEKFAVEMTDKLAGLAALVETDTKEREGIRKALLQMTMDSEDYVAAGTYKKIRSYLGVIDDEAKE